MSSPDANRERRLALNEALIRDVNERIQEGAERFDIKGRADFLCECANDSCSERIRLTIDEYNRIREESTWFFVVPGHEIPTLERVVDQGDEHVIVEKIGEGSEVAERLDPRR
jgi:hypothetical protein